MTDMTSVTHGKPTSSMIRMMDMTSVTHGKPTHGGRLCPYLPSASGGRGARDPGAGANAWQVQQLEHLNRDVHGRGGTCSTCKHVGSATDSSYVA